MDISTYDKVSQDSGETSGASKEAVPGSPLLDWAALEEATKCLKSVAHPIRLRILDLLTDGEYTVGELAELCEVEQATASDHLGRLRDRGILSQDRRGRHVYYRISAHSINGIVTCMRSNFGPRDGEPARRCGN
jgi:DNA-binding transcriptional ArsR family regulator